MQFNVIGDSMQCVVVKMEPGEEVKAEAGSLMYADRGIQIDTKMPGGLLAGIGRMLAGSTLFFTHFHSIAPGSSVAFSAHYPGHMRHLILQGDSWLCSKESFLFSTSSVDIQMAFSKRFGYGFFSGEGFILQRISGQGDLFIHGGGNLVDIDLAPGQNLRVEAGSVVAFQESVSYDIEFIGGLKNALFGGDGIFLISLVGPGRVTLSTLPFSRLAGAILAQAGNQSQTIGSSPGSILGDVFKNI